MKRRSFLGGLLAALGVGLEPGVQLSSLRGDVPEAPPAPPCYACYGTGQVYDVTGGMLPCHVCSGAPCPRCGGVGEIPVRGSLGDAGYWMRNRVDGRIPEPLINKYVDRPCPRCSMTPKEQVSHYVQKAIDNHRWVT